MKDKLTRWTPSTRARRVLAGLAVSAAASGLMAGCSNKPPGCAAPETVQTLREVIASQAERLYAIDPSAVSRYFKAHELGVEMITTDGYDVNAKRHDCQATVTVPDASGSAAIHYAVQALKGERSRFLVKTFGDSQPIVYAILKQVAILASAEANRAREKSRLADEKASAKAAEETSVRLRAVLAEPATASSAGSAAATVVNKSAAGRDASAEAPSNAPQSAVAVNAAPAASGGGAPSLAMRASPSFNCTAKLSPTEQLICDTPALSKADAALALAFTKAVTAAADPGVLKQRQRDWRKTRDACTDADCVQASYASRTEELSH